MHKDPSGLPDDLPPTATPQSAETGAKRPYSPPVLTDYGTVSALTRGGVGTSPDGRGTKKLIRP